MNRLYNENDPKAAAWLRELIKHDLIAPGIVDERSIEDLSPDYLTSFTQCHFFAGIGVWSYALRRAGWSDDRPIWTGSCPCQPFSGAGKRRGTADKRHLWPAFNRLIRDGKPEATPVMGEQVASKDGLAWLDVVQADLEAQNYAVWAADICAAGVGAPMQRQRLYWLAYQPLGDASDERLQERIGECRVPGREGDTGSWEAAERASVRSGILANTMCPGRSERRTRAGSGPATWSGSNSGTGPTNGFWRDADWLLCTDGKWRAVEARIQQMVNGTALRLGPLCSILQKQTQEILNEASKRLQTETAEILREVRSTINSAHIFEWGGGVFLVHETQILLSYLLKYARQERNEPDTGNGESAGSPKRDLRMLWRDREFSDPSYKRRLDGQPLRELSDALCSLSSAVARFASEAEYPMLFENAPASFPTGIYIPENSLGNIRSTNRATRLKGYGNALCAEQAQAFIEAVMDDI